ncbi:MAG: enoyl-CoA hydratase [Candidatus Rokubacteria bacterium]|nr:enoyl-CoA hydratase [Candidatus Rokubacteria bacterium]
MGYEQITYDVGDRIATITLNRPQRLNAWTDVMEREVRGAMTAAAGDDGVRVIVLTGAGRGFCAGSDMDVLKDISAAGAVASAGDACAIDERARPDFLGKYAYFPTVPKPVIGAINGAAAGLGLVVALYCDVRFAADSAVFTTAFSRRGLIAEHGVSWMLPRLVGLPAALDLLLSGRKFDAAEALRLGLVNRVVPAADLGQSVRAYALELATLVSPISLRVIKRQLWDAQFQTLAEATVTAEEEMRRTFATDDFREGIAHFVEKRAPTFTGR